MSNYTKIDSIDPKFLANFLNPKGENADAFLHIEDEKKTVLVGEKEYTVEYCYKSDSPYAMNKLWEENSFYLTGESSASNGREDELKERGFKKVRDLLKKRTFYYDLADVVVQETEQNDPCESDSRVRISVNEEGHVENVILPPNAPELTCAQVRQRVLYFIAMAAMLKKETVIEKVIKTIESDQANARKRVFAIAYLPLFDKTKSGLFSTHTCSIIMTKLRRNYLTIQIEWSSRWGRALKLNAADIFEFPEGKHENKPAGSVLDAMEEQLAAPVSESFSYSDMDRCVSMDKCLSIIETDKKGVRQFHREKNRNAVIQVDGKEFTVKYNMSTKLKKLWSEYEKIESDEWKYEHYYDPDDVMRRMPDVPSHEFNDHGDTYLPTISLYFPRDAATFTQEQTKLRHLWFARACSMAGKDEIMEKIIKLMPCKKNGSLFRRRTLYLATLFYTISGTMIVLIAQNTGDYEVTITLRDQIDLSHKELNVIHSDAASIYNLFA